MTIVLAVMAFVVTLAALALSIHACWLASIIDHQMDELLRRLEERIRP